MFVLLPSVTWADPGKKKIVMLIGAGDSLVVARVFRDLKVASRDIGSLYL
jgi:hypothetical protein